MISKELQAARDYELQNEKKIAQEKKPGFHLTPRVGWMNDPNGFSYYNGQCHMFYQYHPYNTDWGPMHWGHAVSRDLLHWEYLPAAMAPDQTYDNFGCFSGTALTLPDGKQLLMYTGVQKADPEDEKSLNLQTQCIAVGDGLNYEKYEGNPVLTEANLPEGASKVDFRDPKIWQEKDGTFRCVAGSREKDGSGLILLFSSEDGYHWEYTQKLLENKNRYGKMWECPDFFELDGKCVLLASPQDMMADNNLEYTSGNGTICVLGTMDEENRLVEEADQTVDYGTDFYAPQTTLLPDGRRVMMGWMQNWDSCANRMDHMKWFGQMSLPRELSIVNGKLIQQPMRELEAMHQNTVEYKDVMMSGKHTLDKIQGRMIDMTLEIEPENDSDSYQEFSVLLAENTQFSTRITYDPKKSTVEMDRRYSGVRRACMNQRECKVKDQQGKLSMRIILDRFSAEIFINGGEQVITMTLFTDLEADGISFITEGNAKVSVTKSDIVCE